jgi:hypothetical protein
MARGVSHFGAFGADTAAGDVIQSDAFQAPPILLSGTADAINLYNQTGNNYIITTGSADATTLGTPVSGQDDNLSLAVWSNTAYAHSITLTAAHFQTGAGSALKTTITFPADPGAGVLLRAFQGNWQIVGSTGTLSFS